MTRYRNSSPWRRLAAAVVVAMTGVATLSLSGHGIAVGSGTGFEPGRYTVVAEFPRAVGLYTQSRVYIDGLEAGKVTDVESRADRVVVTMHVDDVPLVAEATATLRLRSLIGERYVELGPQWTGKGPQLGDGGRIPLERAIVPAEISDVLDEATRVSEQVDSSAVNAVVEQLATAFGGDRDVLGGLISNLSGASAAVAANLSSLDAALASVDQVMANLASRDDRIVSLLDRGALVSEALVTQDGALDAAITGLDRMLGELTTFSRGQRAGFAAAFDDLDRIGRILTAHQADLAKILEYAPLASFGFARAITNDGDRTYLVPQVTGLLVAPYVPTLNADGGVGSEIGDDRFIPSIDFAGGALDKLTPPAIDLTPVLGTGPLLPEALARTHHPRRRRGGPTVNRRLVLSLRLGMAALVVLAASPLLLRLRPADMDDYAVELADATGLVPRNDVRLDDVVVGRVTSVKVDGLAAHVGFEVDPDYHLPAGTGVEVRQTSVLGENYLELVPQGSGRLEPGSTIPLERSRRRVDLEDVVSVAGELTAQVNVDNINRVLAGVDRGIGSDPARLQRFFDTSAGAADAFAASKDDLARTIESIDSLSASLAPDTDTYADAIARFAGGAEALAKSNDQLAPFIDRVGALSGEFSGLLDRNNVKMVKAFSQIEPRLTELLGNLDEVVGVVNGLYGFNKGWSCVTDGLYLNFVFPLTPELATLDLSPDRCANPDAGPRGRQTQQIVVTGIPRINIDDPLGTGNLDIGAGSSNENLGVTPTGLSGLLGGLVPSAPEGTK